MKQIFLSFLNGLPIYLLLLLPLASASAATFNGAASIKVDDPNNALTSTSGVFTVSCWVRIAIPSSVNLTENMVILMDRTDGNESANYSYQIRFNYQNGRLEFLSKGATSSTTNTLIANPYLERWYHLAVVRNGTSLTTYVDGRQISNITGLNLGSTTGSGLSIGGINGNARLFYGDINEVAIYRKELLLTYIQANMFKDQTSADYIVGYYKLGYSTNSADNYRNFVPVPSPSTSPAAKLGTGTIDFEETDQAGEQSAFDSRKNKGADAIAPMSGSFSWNQTAMARGTPGIAFEFAYGYSSATPTQPPADGSTDPYDPRTLSRSWRHTFETRIMPDSSSSTRRLVTWDGGIETWVKSNNVWQTQHREYRGELVILADSSDYEWTTPNRLVYHFRDPTLDSADPDFMISGRLTQIRDFNSNSVQIVWNKSQGYVDQVIDTAGVACQFRYDALRNLLTNLSYLGWQVNFTYDATNRLVAKSLTNTSGLYTPVNTTWQFSYNSGNGLLERITDPRSNSVLYVQYDKYGRKTNEVDAISRRVMTEYGVPAKRQIRITDSENYQWLTTLDRKGRQVAGADPLGNTTRATFDDAGNQVSTTDALGNTTLMTYDSRANVVARTNALGEVTRWVYHSFFNKATQTITPQPLNVTGSPTWTNSYVLDDATGNLLRHYDSLGTLVTYAYTTNGLVSTSTDANGNVSRMFYDTNGFLARSVDPAGYTSGIANNELGWDLAVTNALWQVVTSSYDLNGNVVRAVDPLNRVVQKTIDAAGNVTAQSDAKGQWTYFSYDAANQKTQMVDRAGFKWNFTYTPRGKPYTVTDPLTNSVTSYYDAALRLTNVADAFANAAKTEYDANGNVTAVIDKVGQRWTKTYDRLNRVVTESDPLGNTKTTTYDVAGRVTQVTTPNGNPTLNYYDGRGRLRKWVDAENNPWQYVYDGNANITDIIDVLGGHYLMSYSNRNERVTERNQDNFLWRYQYDELLRLKRQTDPNGTTRTLDYDAGGRILSVAFNTGRINSFAYDDNNNPQVLSRSGSGPATISQLDFDLLDRVREYRDTFGKRIQYQFDPRGLIASLTYPDGKILTNRFDAIGRLTNQVFNGLFTNTYAFDKADRLIQRSYPNGVAQTNTFDEAGRITGLNYAAVSGQTSAVSIALSYAYDRNGNKTASTEKGTLRWSMPTLTDETARYTASGRLIDRQINNTSVTSNQLAVIGYQYDASGNMTNASGNGQSWTLTYDEDNRTTSVLWDSGIVTKAITNRYDSLGRRVAKTVDGQEQRYVLDLAGKMERILCDVTASGVITAWYVHGPDLCFRIDATTNLLCYHADAQANIIALTGANGTNTALYAYTPYGRSLVSTNFVPSTINSQPYTFVGSQGVMEEVPGLFFMRARYYSADAGVFLSTDPVKNIGPGWQSTIMSYAKNNPTLYIDPTGNRSVWNWAGDMVGIAVGGLIILGGISVCGTGAGALVGVPVIAFGLGMTGASMADIIHPINDGISDAHTVKNEALSDMQKADQDAKNMAPNGYVTAVTAFNQQTPKTTVIQQQTSTEYIAQKAEEKRQQEEVARKQLEQQTQKAKPTKKKSYKNAADYAASLNMNTSKMTATQLQTNQRAYDLRSTIETGDTSRKITQADVDKFNSVFK
ncbi:MAG: LamG-like jellyroll fold domain-containing protein [Verrucomicrobiota bacterium]